MQSAAFRDSFFWLYFVTLSDEHKLRLLENEVLRGVFGTVRDDVG